MLSGEGNTGERWKTTIGLISKKQLCTWSTLFCTFLCRCLARQQRETTRNFLVTLLMEEVSYVFSFTFSFTAAHFHLAFDWWPLAFFILSPPLQNFYVVLPTKNVSFFSLSRSRSLSPFFSLSFAGLPPNFSFSLSFSCSIFQICGHDN